jgi:hypothetical protein
LAARARKSGAGHGVQAVKKRERGLDEASYVESFLVNTRALALEYTKPNKKIHDDPARYGL